MFTTKGRSYPNDNSRIVYYAQERSFLTIGSHCSGVASIMINEINLEIDGDGTVICIWGYSPFEEWEEGNITLPKFRKSKLIYRRSITEGVSIRNFEHRYIPIVDRRRKTLFVGELSEFDEVVSFVPGAIAGIVGDYLCALWIGPFETIR